MAENVLTLTVRIRDAERFRLFEWELMALRDEMRVMASPHAERFDRILARYIEGGDDEGGGEDPAEVEWTTEIVEPCPDCGYTEEAQGG